MYLLPLFFLVRSAILTLWKSYIYILPNELPTASSFWSKADQWSLWLSKLITTFATLQGSTLLSGRLSQFWSPHWWAFNQTLLLCRTIRNKWSLQIVCLGTEREKYKIHLLTQTALAKYFCSLVCKRTSSPVLPKTSWRWQDAVTVLGIYKKHHFSWILKLG